MVGRTHALAAGILLLHCFVGRSCGKNFEADGEAEGIAYAEQAPHSRRSPAPRKITEAVSVRDCGRDQLPRHLREDAPTKPADFMMTTGYGYKPYQTRAFLTTFRRHNRDARVLIFVSPENVRPPLNTHSCTCHARAAVHAPMVQVRFVLLLYAVSVCSRLGAARTTEAANQRSCASSLR